MHLHFFLEKSKGVRPRKSQYEFEGRREVRKDAKAAKAVTTTNEAYDTSKGISMYVNAQSIVEEDRLSCLHTRTSIVGAKTTKYVYRIWHSPKTHT